MCGHSNQPCHWFFFPLDAAYSSHKDKEKVVEILQRLEEYEPPQAEISEAEASLEERLANLDLGMWKYQNVLDSTLIHALVLHP